MSEALLRRVWSNRQLRARLEADEANSGGSGSPGAAIIRKFPFAFDTPGLSIGVEVYTPAAGDILLDAWVEFVVAWDGATPQCDIGAFHQSGGLFETLFGQAIPAQLVDIALTNGGLASGQSLTSLRDGWVITMPTANDGDSLFTVSGANVNLVADPVAAGSRVLPARLTGDPIKVCVSQDGSITGGDPGSTQGEAVLYLVTATPV